MGMEVRNAQLGDTVQLMITGMIGHYTGKVIEMDKDGLPIIQVEETGLFARLKMGDYILIER